MKEIGFKVQLNKEIDKNPFSVTPWYTLCHVNCVVLISAMLYALFLRKLHIQ